MRGDGAAPAGNSNSYKESPEKKDQPEAKQKGKDAPMKECSHGPEVEDGQSEVKKKEEDAAVYDSNNDSSEKKDQPEKEQKAEDVPEEDSNAGDNSHEPAEEEGRSEAKTKKEDAPATDNNNDLPKKKEKEEDAQEKNDKSKKDPKAKRSGLFLGRKTIMLSILAIVVSSAGIAKLLMRNAGVTEAEVFNTLIANNIMPNFDSSWMNQFNTTSIGTNYEESRKLRAGFQLAKEGARAKHPVIMVPGFITSGLELWEGEECARKQFRQRLWGSLSVFMQSFFSDRECWQRHLSLDPFTGMDPPNIRLRAAEGFSAADYFMSTIWVWEKVIENLADVGYDVSNMIMMSYDWRLAFPLLEERDGYLTKLKVNIEAFHKTTGEKVVLMAHSMGSQVVLYFFQWVTTDEKSGGGGGGKKWVDEHIYSFVNVAGPLLGVPKSVPALLSGEMKDTAVLLGPMGSIMENLFGRKMRKELWNSWGSLWAMIPKGGDAFWGIGADFLKESEPAVKGGDVGSSLGAEYERTDCSVPDDGSRFEAFIAMQNETSKSDGNSSNDKTVSVLSSNSTNQTPSPGTSWTLDQTIEFLMSWGGGLGPNISSAKLHDFKPKSTSQKLEKVHWHDPTVTPLPHAPNMKMYCLYGIGVQTERSYFYKPQGLPENKGDGDNTTDPDVPIIIDTSFDDPKTNVRTGVRFADGDISVPILSSGFMCVDGWKAGSNLNPSNMKIITREYQHKEEFQLNDPIRGGPQSADHLDILGNFEFTKDVLKIATGFNLSSVTQILTSDIENIIKRINDHPKGGLKALQTKAEGKKSFWKNQNGFFKFGN